MELCAVCGKNETARLMDEGWGEKKPVCTDCLTSGRWRELLPAPEPKAKEPTERQIKEAKEAAEAEAQAKAKAEPKPHKHFYRKDGTCACGAVLPAKAMKRRELKAKKAKN